LILNPLWSILLLDEEGSNDGGGAGISDLEAAVKAGLEAASGEEPEEEREEEVEEESNIAEPEFNEQELEQTKQLLRTLANPALAGTAVENMAAQLGFELVRKGEKPKDPDNRAETTQSVSEKVAAAITDNLGKEYKFLGDRIAKGMQAALEIYVSDRLNPIDAKLNASEESNRVGIVETAMNNVYNSFENIDAKIKAKVLVLQDSFDVRAGTSPEEYFNTLVHAAASSLGVTLSKTGANRQDKINKSRNDASSRIASQASRRPGEPAQTDGMSLDDAIRKGMEEANK
jgi:hypothetical protein